MHSCFSALGFPYAPLLPHTGAKAVLWPLILGKAILKLNAHYLAAGKEMEMPIISNLTGWTGISEKVPRGVEELERLARKAVCLTVTMGTDVRFYRYLLQHFFVLRLLSFSSLLCFFMIVFFVIFMYFLNHFGS